MIDWECGVAVLTGEAGSGHEEAATQIVKTFGVPTLWLTAGIQRHVIQERFDREGVGHLVVNSPFLSMLPSDWDLDRWRVKNVEFGLVVLPEVPVARLLRSIKDIREWAITAGARVLIQFSGLAQRFPDEVWHRTDAIFATCSDPKALDVLKHRSAPSGRCYFISADDQAWADGWNEDPLGRVVADCKPKKLRTLAITGRSSGSPPAWQWFTHPKSRMPRPLVADVGFSQLELRLATDLGLKMETLEKIVNPSDQGGRARLSNKARDLGVRAYGKTR